MKTNGMRVALLLAVVIAAASAVLFLKQGGFGGGHGDFDKIIFILGLPWTGIPWPQFIIKHDFIWLIGLPLAMNAMSVLAFTVAVRRLAINKYRAP